MTVPDAWASVAFFQQLANHDRVVDAIRKGSESPVLDHQRAPRAGRRSRSRHSDRFTSSYDISYDASYELADLVYLLSSVEGVDLDSVNVDGDVSNSAATYSVAGNEQLVKGVWKKVNNRNPATVRRAAELQLRVVLRGSDGTTAKVPYAFKIPKRAAGNRGQVFLTGGNDFFSEEFFYDEFGGAKSLSDIKSYVDGLVRNDQIAAQLFIGGSPRAARASAAGARPPARSRRTPRSVRRQGRGRLQAAQDRRQAGEGEGLSRPSHSLWDARSGGGGHHHPNGHSQASTHG